MPLELSCLIFPQSGLMSGRMKPSDKISVLKLDLQNKSG